MQDIILENDRLRLTIEACEGNEITSTRFDRSCRIKSVILDGKYEFARPEQFIKSRVTANGFGLSAEWSCPELGAATAKGEYFYKPGVGLLKQNEDNKAYGIFDSYDCITQPVFYSTNSSETGSTENTSTELTVEMPAQDTSGTTMPLSIKREISLKDNTVSILTTVTNHGTKNFSAQEYQHNFFAIEGIPVGPGYKLQIPYIDDLRSVSWESPALDEVGAPCGTVPMSLDIDKNSITWNRKMDNNAYYVCFTEEHIKDLTEVFQKEPQEKLSAYQWKLSHSDSIHSVSETMDFVPVRQDIWGVEHCVCSEAFCDIQIKPGETKSFCRTWLFE